MRPRSPLITAGGRPAPLLASLLLLLPGQVLASAPDWISPGQRDHPLAGTILNANGEAVPESQLLAALALAQYAFIGEKHDNPDHHRIESSLIAHRLASLPESAIVFEMLDDTQQAAVATLTRGDSLDEIKLKLAWPDKGWDFAAYGPLFQASLAAGKLSAGNIGKPMIGRLYEEGEPLLEGDPRFRTAVSASAETRQVLLDSIYEAHCGMQSRDSLSPMLAIQLAKDASMANAMVDSPNALLIAGGEHTRPNTGVPSHLRKLAPDATQVVIQLVEVTANDTDPQAYIERAGPADFYWLTAATEIRDYCADVKGRAAK